MSDRPAQYTGGGKPSRDIQRVPAPPNPQPQAPGLAKVIREIQALAPPNSTIVFIPMCCRRGGRVTAVFLVRREGGGEPVNELFTSLPYTYYEEAVRVQRSAGGARPPLPPPQATAQRPQPAATAPHTAQTLKLWGQFPINPKYRCGRCGATSYLKCGSCGALLCWDGETRHVTCGSCGVDSNVMGAFESIEGGVKGRLPSGGGGGGGGSSPPPLPRGGSSGGGGGGGDRPALPPHHRYPAG